MIATPNRLLEIENIHSEECGQPPTLRKTAGDGKYLGYFQNSYDEQWVIEIDRQNKTGILRAGDVAWEPIRIVDDRITGDVVIGEDEYAWASTCWRAATASELKRPLGLADLFGQFGA